MSEISVEELFRGDQNQYKNKRCIVEGSYGRRRNCNSFIGVEKMGDNAYNLDCGDIVIGSLEGNASVDFSDKAINSYDSSNSQNSEDSDLDSDLSSRSSTPRERSFTPPNPPPRDLQHQSRDSQQFFQEPRTPPNPPPSQEPQPREQVGGRRKTRKSRK